MLQDFEQFVLFWERTGSPWTEPENLVPPQKSKSFQISFPSLDWLKRFETLFWAMLFQTVTVWNPLSCLASCRSAVGASSRRVRRRQCYGLYTYRQQRSKSLPQMYVIFTLANSR